MEHKDFTETIFNLETGQTTVRNYTPAEIEEVMAERAESEAKTAAKQAVTNAKASRDAKLAKMGFTLAEIENW